MHKIIQTLVASAALAASAAAVAKVDVNVGVTIREPGVYGRIEIGTAPPPPVYYPQPVVITQPVVVAQPVAVQPMYLYVPPGHAKKWGKHCHKYDACARPVYFVKEEWVQTTYQQAHPEWKKGKPQAHPGKGHGHGKGQGQGQGKGKKDD
jgi:hypothetical protein